MKALRERPYIYQILCYSMLFSSAIDDNIQGRKKEGAASTFLYFILKFILFFIRFLGLGASSAKIRTSRESTRIRSLLNSSAFVLVALSLSCAP